MKKLLILLGLLFIAVLLTTIINPANLTAADHIKKGGRFKYMDQLTEEQRETIKNTVRDLHDSGETPENIHEKVKEMLTEYGIEVPEDTDLFPGRRGHRPGKLLGRHFKNLSEEQKDALKEKVDQLHEQGASHEEIRAEVQKMLKEFGVDVPDDSLLRMGRRKGFPHGFPGIDLSKEQRMAIREKVKSLRESKAGREEIHAAVTEMLKGYGIEVPEKLDRHGEKWQCLTDEQRQVIRTKIREMRESGASREEIHEAVKKMHEEFKMREEEDSQPSGQILQNTSKNFSIQSYPNPFNPETNILYNIKSPVHVTLRIYDVQGQLVRALVNDYQQPGNYSVRWNGLNQNGVQVPSGVYFLRIHAGEESSSQRLVMMK